MVINLYKFLQSICYSMCYSVIVSSFRFQDAAQLVLNRSGLMMTGDCQIKWNVDLFLRNTPHSVELYIKEEERFSLF